MAIDAKAVCFTQADTAELLDVSWGEPGPDHVVVRMNVSGISAGTEGSIFRGIRTHNGTFPLITGYQGAGVVEWVGDHAAPLQVGDRVAVTSVAGDLIEQDLQIVWGTHCSTVVARPGAVYPIPEGVGDDEASLCTLWAVGLQGTTVTEVQPGDTVLVVGLGLIGLSYAQCATAAGAEVIGLDLAEERAQVLRDLGAEAFTEQDAVRAWLDERGLRGFDVAVEATGKASVIDVPLRMVRPDGKVVWQGWYPGRVDFEYHDAHSKQVHMVFPHSTGGFQPDLLQMIADGSFEAGSLITHHFPVEQCQEAYDLAVFRPMECLGVVMEWSR